MRRNVIETVMGGVVLIVAAMFVGIAFQSGTVTTPAGYQIIAEFDDASGLGPGERNRRGLPPTRPYPVRWQARARHR